MTRPENGISIRRKFLIVLVAVLAVAVSDYWLFHSKSNKVQLYDELTYRLSSIRVSVTKLEYLLDMFVVARRFEGTTINLIRNDVEDLDESIKEVLEGSRYSNVFRTDTQLAEGVSSISEDWQLIKEEVARLNTAATQDEVMLIHNAVDLHTIIVTEKTERLLGLISEDRTAVFSQVNTLMLLNIVGSVVVFLIASFGVYRFIVIPMRKTAETSRRVASGWPALRFAPSPGVVGALSGELNGMLDRVEGVFREKEEERNRMAESYAYKLSQIEVLKAVASVASESISRPRILAGAARETAHAGRADGVAILLDWPSGADLKAVEGFDDNIREALADSSSVSFLSGDGPPDRGRASRVYEGSEKLPDARLAETLRDAGYGAVLVAPVEYDRKVLGCLVAGFTDPEALTDDNRPFFEAVALNIGVLHGYLELFSEERDWRKFLERVTQQMPYGVAVFDFEGRCVTLNSLARKYLGAASSHDFPGSYMVFEDEVFSSGGMTQSIRKAYEGYTTEFVINYDPMVRDEEAFGEARRLRIKSLPLYGAGGEITEIMLLYEDVSESGLDEGPEREGGVS